MSRASAGSALDGKYRSRVDEILFIDARNMGHLINRRTREFSDEDIATIADTYHNWRSSTSSANGSVGSADVSGSLLTELVEGNNRDVPGFCKSESVERVQELDYVLTPGRYVGLPEEEDDFNFAERFTQLQAEFAAQLVEEERLNGLIQQKFGEGDRCLSRSRCLSRCRC